MAPSSLVLPQGVCINCHFGVRAPLQPSSRAHCTTSFTVFSTSSPSMGPNSNCWMWSRLLPCAPSLNFLRVSARTKAETAASKAQAERRMEALLAACRGAFRAGQEPAEANLSAVRDALDCITAEDLALKTPTAAVPASPLSLVPPAARKGPSWFGGTPTLTYMHVCECADFSIGIFLFPASACIPLHDHPGMTVLSKLLYGSLHVVAFDWAEEEDGAAPGAALGRPRRARQVHDMPLHAPTSPLVLRPASCGNIHQFTALSSCAMLDVLAPPYDTRWRPCTYFERQGRASDGEKEEWLRAIPQPPWLRMRESLYRGSLGGA